MDKTNVEKAKSRLHTAQEELSAAGQELGAYIQFGRPQPGDPMNDPKVIRMSERIKELEQKVGEAEAELQIAEAEAQRDLWAQEQKAREPKPSPRMKELQGKYDEIAGQLEGVRKELKTKKSKLSDSIRTSSDPTSRVAEVSRLEMRERDLVIALQAIWDGMQEEKAAMAKAVREEAAREASSLLSEVNEDISRILTDLYRIRDEARAADVKIDKARSLISKFGLVEFGIVSTSTETGFVTETLTILDGFIKRINFGSRNLVERAGLKQE